MSSVASNPLSAFQWTPQPQAERFVRQIVEDFLKRCPGAAELSRRMKSETGTRFIDWIESIVLPDSPALRSQLADAGYAGSVDRETSQFVQPLGMFPRIVLRAADTTAVHLKVQSVADFAAVNQVQGNIEGEELQYRRLVVCGGDRAELVVSERWGWTGFDLPPHDARKSIAASRWLDAFRARRREFDTDIEGIDYTHRLVESCPLPVDQKCALWFFAEREYWMRRNRAAQVQYARQQRLGLGWANHDHHTYRSSRAYFTRLVALWEKLGLKCRERFYAGREAGWGAQVMEQPNAGIITFNDVDLSPDELMSDFSHDELPPREQLGTIGLWCALHGEAVLQAGMHHLECQFDFDALKAQLESEAGLKTMKPFTNFPYLRQAFTEGERWAVKEPRIQRALNAGYITEEQARQFREQGAIGSHLENLERNEGFKGFNQTGVSEIIAATDPRKHTT